jgi:hypothetical protein
MIIRKLAGGDTYVGDCIARIDQIWISSQLAHKILDYKCTEQFFINTDHRALILILDWFEYNPLHIASNKKYNFRKLKSDTLANFAEEIELRLNNPSTLFWNLLNSAIKASLEINIPKNKQRIKRSNTIPLIIKKESLIIKSIKNSIRKIKNNLPLPSPILPSQDIISLLIINLFTSKIFKNFLNYQLRKKPRNLKNGTLTISNKHIKKIISNSGSVPKNLSKKLWVI